jgi:hypothetical protein
MVRVAKLIPIFNSRGEVGAILVFPYIYNLSGEWIGWVTPEREVFSVHGVYVGFLTKDPRILRKREMAEQLKRQSPPPPPSTIQIPSLMPLAPVLPEVAQNMIDVLEEADFLLPPKDSGEHRQDLD